MNSSFSSWEELAFAEDASGILGGCVWPPRSYSCSFCRREFRSAQALGGHMNVHRRDRARLKQSSHAPAVSNNHLDDYDDAPPAIFSSAFYNIPNNPDFTPHLSLSSQLIRVSRSPDLAYTPGLCFQMTPERRLEKKRKDRLLSHSQPLSWSTSFVVAGKSGDRGLIKIYQDSKKSEVLDDENDSSSLRKDDCATKGLSVNLDLAVCQAQESNYASSNNGEEVASCKRRRVEAAKQLPSLFPKKTTSSSSIEMRSCLPHSEVFKLCSGAAEELDLELRLGNAPKVK